MYERWWPLEGLEGHSIFVGESLPPFAFVVGHPGQSYDVVTVRRSQTPLDLYLVGAPDDYEDPSAQQFPDAEVINTELEDIWAEVESHGYRGVYLEGMREHSRVLCNCFSPPLPRVVAMVERRGFHQKGRTAGTGKQVIPIHLCTVFVSRFKHLPLSAWGELKRVMNFMFAHT